MLSFASISRLNWIDHVNRMDSKRKVSKVHSNIPQGSRIRGRLKNRWWNCVQTDINKCKITNWRGRSKNRADCEKFIKVRKIRMGMQCHRRREEEEEEEEEEEDDDEEEEEEKKEKEEEEKEKENENERKKKPVTSLLHLHFIHYSHALIARSFLSVLSLGEVVKNPSTCIIFFVSVRM